jgi:hypothetical protein
MGFVLATQVPFVCYCLASGLSVNRAIAPTCKQSPIKIRNPNIEIRNKLEELNSNHCGFDSPQLAV